MLQMLIILSALFIGYACKSLPFSMHKLNQFLTFAVIGILFIMGYDFGCNSASLSAQILTLSKIIGLFTILLLFFNFIALYIIFKDKYRHGMNKDNLQQPQLKAYKYFLESSKYLIYLVLGITLGCILKIHLPHLSLIINGVLIVVLFVIGFQLRMQNIALKTILANRVGLTVVCLIVFSSLVAGLIAGKILNLPIATSLSLVSGFGWYTLSGILVGNLINQQMGAAAFFIDFLREILAIILIPLLGKHYPVPLVGYSGATAMDFTLPIIKVNLEHKSVIPIAITSGMLLSVLTPILIPLFSRF